MAKREDITSDYVRQLLDYNPNTGIFRWRISRGGWGPRRIAGRVEYDGYRRIGINGKQYPAHHLAWLYIHGEWPRCQLDHKNGNRDDNRISELRLSTQSQNVANSRLRSNNTTGFKGVSKTASGRYLATIKVDGKSRYLGIFDTPEEAHEAYMEAARKAFNEFARSK